MPETSKMDRNLALEAVRVTEAAALSASRWMGRGDEKAADQAAVDAMRAALNSLSIAGTVVIGEGERDEAPMLYIGEKVGTGNGPPIDIALDPLEGQECRDVLAEIADVAGRRLLEPRDDSQGRGLASGIRADDADDLAAVHLEAHVVQDVDLGVVAIDPVKLEHAPPRGTPRSPPSR